MRVLVILAVVILPASPALGGPPAMTIEQAMKASTDPHSLALARKTHLLVGAGDAVGLAHHMIAVKEDPSLGDPARERLLHDAAMSAVRVQPDEALENFVRRLASYESRTLVWTDEHGFRETRPLFDFAATSRHVRRIWAEEQSRDQAAVAIDTGDFEIVTRYAQGTTAERAGMSAAFQEASGARLAVYQPVLLDTFGRGEPVDELAVIVAVRTGDDALMEAVMSAGTPDATRRAIDTVLLPKWTGRSSRLLEIAAAREDVGSAAVLALGRLANIDPDAVDFLFDSLGGPSGTSAAAALARIADSNIVARLSAMLHTSGDEITRRHVLLGLRLADSAAASEALADFARDPVAPSGLVAEVPSWLRD